MFDDKTGGWEFIIMDKAKSYKEILQIQDK
jgi:hypothetical protein